MIRTFFFCCLIASSLAGFLFRQQCIHNDKLYKKGESYQKDDCNSCTCHKYNRFECTDKKCKEPEKKPKDTRCWHHTRYADLGESFKFDCHKCKCFADDVVLCKLKRKCPFFHKGYMEGYGEFPE